jgi:segregation and condensation protein B
LIANQSVSITSDKEGTTTDAVEKAMELLPIGPVLFIDSAGFDDTTELGMERMKKNDIVYRRADIIIWVANGNDFGDTDKNFLQKCIDDKRPVAVVFNKADLYQVPAQILDEIKSDLQDKYMGVQLSVHGESYRLCTKEEYADAVASYIAKGRTPGLSNAAMEVLAIVAYNQPTTKTYVSEVRGVASAEVMESLVDKDLLEPQGRLDLPGRPMSYGTTDKFLTVFGLESIDSLPSRELFMEGLAGIQNEDQPVEVYEQLVFEESEE